MKTFKTPKGTELPIMDIKGKDYLQAAPRIVWFREEKPEWGIETEFLSLSDSHAVCRATIRNETGRIIAQATSMETKQGFESFVEKAETCAVSRAASFCNFGTLMAQELEEQGRLDERPPSDSAKFAEAPQQPKVNNPTSNGVSEGKISEKQAARLFAIWKKSGMPEVQLRSLIKTVGGVESSKDLHFTKYNQIVKTVEGWKPEPASFTEQDIPY